MSKYITVPKSVAAAERLDRDEADPDEIIEWNLNDSEYQDLWKSEVLDKLNASLDIHIDDYESEEIRSMEGLKSALSVVSDIIKSCSPEKKNVIEKLRHLVASAIEAKTEIHFDF